ncbi:FliH/SctL family protein [Massilia endophytica]|uniref:FliH/SctL family protein n=1 Tax=Massilia endophytica TaxID=2899220 RepID=UPI001E559194|nr:FliH/SctL family protein [Massilia endophytica]UGQ47969.1 hypothetical protein LSQ66_05750 [Massilia endophytica]
MAAIMHAPHLSGQRRTLWKGGQEPAPAPQAGPAEAAPAPAPAMPQPAAAAGPAIPAAAPATPSGEDLARRRQQQAAQEEQERTRRQQQALEQAVAAARDAGYGEGFARGDQEARAALAQAHQRLEALAAALERQLDAGLTIQEDLSVALAFEVASQLVGEALVSREAVLARVRSVLARTRERERLVIRLHPDDLALVEEAPLSAASPSGARLDWIADPALGPGDCIAVAAGGQLEARIARQLAQFGAALCAARAAGTTASEA